MNGNRLDGFLLLLLVALVYPVLPGYFIIIDTSTAIRDIVVVVGLFFAVLLCPTPAVHIHKDALRVVFWLYVWVGTTMIVQLCQKDIAYAFKDIFVWSMLVVCALMLISSRQRFLMLIDTIITGAVCVGFFGIIEEFTGFNVYSLVNFAEIELNYNRARFGFLRIISFTSHAISYCAYCMLVLGLVFYRITVTRGARCVKYLVAYMLIVLNAFFTLSRMALLCIILSQLMMLWFSGYRYFFRKIFIIGIIALASLLVGVLSNDKIRDGVVNAFYTVAVFFNRDYTHVLASAGLDDNTQGIGDRLRLYKWVWNAVRGSLWFGRGRRAVFRHIIVRGVYTIFKTSIEVEYLRSLWRYGIVGALSEIAFFGMLPLSALRKNAIRKRQWEGRLSFSAMCFALFASYALLMLGVMQNEDKQLFSVIVMLLIAYLTHDGYEKKKEKKKGFWLYGEFIPDQDYYEGWLI